jgi:phosphoglycolate phosphatase-like HAD superfamily hydrolase
MTIKNIFFDFDGVLAESVNVKTQAFHDLYVQYGSEIAKKVVAHHRTNGGMSRFEKFKIYHKEFLNQEINEFKVEELAQQFSTLVVQGVVDSEEIRGAKAFLEKFHGKIRYWIITGTPTEEMKKIAKRRGIDTYFEEICGSPTKKPIWTEYLLDKYNLKREETLFLGDATSDYNASIHSKLYFALRSYDENKELFANYTGIRFSDFSELQQKINFQ